MKRHDPTSNQNILKELEWFDSEYFFDNFNDDLNYPYCPLFSDSPQHQLRNLQSDSPVLQTKNIESTGNIDDQGEKDASCMSVYPKKKRISRMKVQYCKEAREARDTCLKGNRYETHNMGRHFYFQTLSFLKILSSTKAVSQIECNEIEKFSKTKGSLDGFRELFSNEDLQKRCLEYYSSTILVKSIMRSPLMATSTKLTLIKFLKKLSSLPHVPTKGWK